MANNSSLINRNQDPVIIWAPSTRCGTTLIQRLITSSQSMIVFGEDLFLIKDIPHMLTWFEEQSEPASQALEKFSRGEVNFWSPNVFPDLEQYSNLMVQFFYSIVGHYKQTADDRGFDKWGVKTPKFDQTAYDILTPLLPHAYHLFVIRNINDVLKSQKGRGMVSNHEEARENINDWVDNTNLILDEYKDRDDHLTLHYEKVMEQPEKTIGDIEDFLGIGGIDRAVFDHKVNTWNTDGSSYSDPVDLDDAERSMIEELAGDILERQEFDHV